MSTLLQDRVRSNKFRSECLLFLHLCVCAAECVSKSESGKKTGSQRYADRLESERNLISVLISISGLKQTKYEAIVSLSICSAHHATQRRHVGTSHLFQRNHTLTGFWDPIGSHSWHGSHVFRNQDPGTNRNQSTGLGLARIHLVQGMAFFRLDCVIILHLGFLRLF